MIRQVAIREPWLNKASLGGGEVLQSVAEVRRLIRMWEHQHVLSTDA